jgi:hypothetical protein
MKNHKSSQANNQGSRITVGVRIAPIVDAAEDALLRCEHISLYVHGSELVHVVRNQSGPPYLRAVSVDYLRELLDVAATWHRERKDKISQEMVPPWVSRHLLSRSQWRFPRLDGITDTPMLRPDGTVVSVPGYDAVTCYLYEPTIEFPPIPEQPSEQDVRAALATLREPFCDFPFKHEHHRAAVISAVLSLLARSAIDGPIPLYGVTSTAPGSGKSMLVDAISLIAIGTDATREVMPSSDEEMRKRILAQGLQGTRLVLLDNVEVPLGTQSLANVLTAVSFGDRLLGASKMIHVPMRAVWFATGNGLSYCGDLGRRVIPVELDARLEHPEDRRGFQHDDLRAYVRFQRPALVVAGLTLLRAYHLAGRPRHEKPRIGSFESWDDWIRGLCIWIGLGDPAQGRERIRQQSDADLDALRSLMEAWQGVIGPRAVTVADVQGYADTSTELQAAWLGITNQERCDTRALGYVLRKALGRRVGGRMFDIAGKTAGWTRWRLVNAPAEPEVT